MTPPVQRDKGAGTAIGIAAARDLDRDRRPIDLQARGDAGPVLRQAGGDHHVAAAAPDAQDALGRGPVHPGGGTGIPGPAAPSDMGGDGIDVGRHDIGFDPIASGGLRGQRMVDRVHHRQQPRGRRAVAHAGMGQDRPHGGMAVLAAILAQARRIARDIAGVVARRRPVEGRREQQDQPRIGHDQLRQQRPHGASGAGGVGAAGQHGPALRDGIDPAGRRGRRSQPAAIVEGRAPVPVAVPAMRLQRGGKPVGMDAPFGRDRGVAGIGQSRHAAQRVQQQPAQPDALSLSGFADAVHAVVPVARADQRQAQGSGLHDGAGQPQGGVIPQRAALCGQVGQEERIVLTRRHGGSVQIGQVLVQHGQIAGHCHVIRHRMRQPDAIVRNAGPHPLTRMGQPPVLHIALRKLPGCRVQQMCAHPCGLGQRHRHPVLQLIAKAVCAAGLIECRAGLDAAGQRLIGQPAVHHDVHGAVRGRHLDGAGDRLPMRLDLCQQVCGVRIAHPGDQRLCIVGGGRLSQQMPDLHRGARRQQHWRFQRQAGVQARACAPRQAGGRGGQRTVRSQNLGPVAADGGLRAHQVGEHHPVGKGHVPRVADQQGPGVGIAFADQMRRRPGAGDTHYRLRTGDHGQPPRLRAEVADLQGRDPDGALQRHELQQFQRQTACVMVEPAISHAVARHVPSRPRQRAGGGRKDRARVVIADQEGLGRGVRHRVVGPGGQAVFAAVFGPGAARAGGRDVKAETVIGDHVDPGRGGSPALVQDHHVFAPVAGKAAGAVEELQRLGQAGRGVGPGWRAVRHAGHAGGLGGRCSHRGHLIGQRPVARDQHHAGGGEQQRGDLGWQQVAAQGMDLTARRIGLCPRTGTAQRGLNGRLKALDIGRRVFVQDHHVHGQALHAPVFLRQQDLFDLRHVGLIRDAHQHDGQIAGDALRPQDGLLAGCPGGDRGAEPGVGPQDRRGHRLERRGLGRGDPQMAQLHLGLGPGQGPRAVDRVAVMMSVDQVDQARPRVGHHRPEGEPRRPARRDGDAMAQREGRVQHGADPALQRGPRCQGRRVAQIVVAAQKGGAVGLELHGRGLGGLDHREMGGPDARLVRAARAAGGDQRAVFGQVFGLHEHLGKGGMRSLGLLRGQDQLGIGGQLQRHRHAGGRGQRQHSDLCIVLSRHQHLQRGG